MADALRFDVLEAMDELKAAGFSDGQARTLADKLRHAVDVRQGDLATKADVELSAASLRSEISALRGGQAEFRAEVKRDLSELETRLTNKISDQQRWTIGITVTATGLLFAALKLF